MTTIRKINIYILLIRASKIKRKRKKESLVST